MNKWLLSNDDRGVYTLTITREQQRNALDLDLIKGITDVVAGLGSECRVLIVASLGGVFSAGADINWMKDSAKLSAEQNRADANAFALMLKTLNEAPFPTIARVQGAALAGGAGLISCCDVVVAVDQAQFALTEVRLGLIPATIGPYIMSAIGARASRRYFQSAERFDAQRAYDIGLVHEVCKPDELDDKVSEVVNAMLQCGPYAQSQAKKLVQDLAGEDAQLIGSMSDRLAAIRTGAEAQEGFSAFLEKRKPEWIPD